MFIVRLEHTIEGIDKTAVIYRDIELPFVPFVGLVLPGYGDISDEPDCIVFVGNYLTINNLSWNGVIFNADCGIKTTKKPINNELVEWTKWEMFSVHDTCFKEWGAKDD